MDRDELIKEICETERALKRAGRSGRNHSGGEDNSKGKVLTILANADDEIHPGDLCRILAVTTPRITIILNSMEDDGLIERRISKTDRRKFIVVLTSKGQDVINERMERDRALAAALLEKVGEADAGIYLKVLKAKEELLKSEHNRKL